MEHCREDVRVSTMANPALKGGIFSQLCSWLGNEDLWGGGVTDSQYHSEAGYLEEQRQFQESDLVKA